MGQYGEAAKIAAGLMSKKPNTNPVDAWQDAVAQECHSESSKKKSCPKGAFLGLCEEGWVSGCIPGIYTRSVKNKEYAIRAANILLENPKLATDGYNLWKLVIDGEKKKSNEQMDVVISLFKEGYLKEP